MIETEEKDNNNKVIKPLSASHQYLLVVDYETIYYRPIVAIGMLDATQMCPTNHRDKKNDNTIFGENKEHGKALAHCSQPIFSDKSIDTMN